MQISVNNVALECRTSSGNFFARIREEHSGYAAVVDVVEGYAVLAKKPEHDSWKLMILPSELWVDDMQGHGWEFGDVLFNRS